MIVCLIMLSTTSGEQAKKCGVDIFRVFDALNDVDQLEVGMGGRVLKAGGVAEGTICISGDILGK